VALWRRKKAAGTAAAAAGTPGGALGGRFHPFEATVVNGSTESSHGVSSKVGLKN